MDLRGWTLASEVVLSSGLWCQGRSQGCQKWTRVSNMVDPRCIFRAGPYLKGRSSGAEDDGIGGSGRVATNQSIVPLSPISQPEKDWGSWEPNRPAPPTRAT